MRVRLDDLDDRRRQRGRRDRARAVARVHTCFLDVFHHPADDDVAGAVAHRVDVDLGRVLEEAVDQHRPLGREPAFPPERTEAGQLGHRPPEALVVVHDLHGATTEHV